MNRTPSRRVHRPVLFHASVGLVLAALATLFIWGGFNGHWTGRAWLGSWLLGVNFLALGYYGFDKFQARRAGRRVPEAVLHGMALAGGSLGAYAAMRLFRHKTIKGRFRVVFWSIVILQLALIAWLIADYWRHG